MSKFSEYARGRADGLDLALRIVEAYGIEGLRQEIKFRNQTGVQTSIAVKELDKASEKIKKMTLDTTTVLSVKTLHDKFGFGKKRCQQFLDGMGENADPIMKQMETWTDQIKYIQDEIGIELKIRIND